MFRGDKLLRSTWAIMLWAAMAVPSLADGHRLNYAGTPSDYDPYVHRSNFIVSDFEKSFLIYRDLLGFDVVGPLPVRGDSFMYDVFQVDPAATLRIAFLSKGEGEWGNIGMTEVKGVQLPARRPPNPSVLIVEVHGRIERLHEDVQRMGLSTTQIFELSGPSRREFIFSDFDGHRILIMQLHAAD